MQLEWTTYRGYQLCAPEGFDSSQIVGILGDLMLDKTSIKNLNECHINLALFGYALAQYADFKVTTGHRDEDTQNRLFEKGKSKVRWPKSKHNRLPSEAFDIACITNGQVTWDKKQYIYLAGKAKVLAVQLGINLRWGGDWDQDEQVLTDQEFQDLTHFEIKNHQ